MERMNKVESLLVGLYEHAPHLPTRYRKRIADNAWRIALTGVVLLVVGVFIAIPYLFSALAITTTVSVAAPYVSFYQHSLGLTWMIILLNILNFIIVALMLSFAIDYLHEKKKHGWNIVLWSLLVSFILNLASAIVLFSWIDVIEAVLVVAVGGYLLFEVRSQFIPEETKNQERFKKNMSKA